LLGFKSGLGLAVCCWVAVSKAKQKETKNTGVRLCKHKLLVFG